MKKIIGMLAGLALAGTAFGYYTQLGESGESSYRFVAVDRGDIETVVSATGLLEPVTTVEVGTEISGTLAEVLVDFNDPVSEGQVIARLDPTLLEIASREAEANLERNEAELDAAERDFERIRDLAEENIVSHSDLDTARSKMEVAAANRSAAQVAVERARQNLAYTTIRAPISGVVIERDVDVGQTVAASLSAPQLFVLAADLRSMQILVSVDESDIGQIEEGQTARFTVQAYPDELFEGRVRQLRLQPSTVENVVNYDVVVDVQNDGHLLPGMTATVDFEVARAENVLRVANAALRFQPSGSGRGRSDSLFYLDSLGKMARLGVRTGLSDGQYTEVGGGDDLVEGLQVIAGATSSSSSSEMAKNPFQSNQQQDRAMGPPPPPGR